MKKKVVIVEKFLKKLVEKALKMDANSTTCTTVYQPIVPSELKKFSKIEKE